MLGILRLNYITNAISSISESLVLLFNSILYYNKNKSQLSGNFGWSLSPSEHTKIDFEKNIQQFWDNFNYLPKKDGKNILEKEREASKNYPFANLDLKFSLKKEVEEGKNLIAVHNLTGQKLEKALELGAFPMPSIAITKSDMGHTDFGDISLVFGKETIDHRAEILNNLDDVKFSIKKDAKGNDVVVIDTDIIGINTNNIQNIVINEIKKHIGAYYRIAESGYKIYLGKDIDNKGEI